MEQTEKKKRWRPSLTAYRALESECSELREKVSALRKEIDRKNADVKRLRRDLAAASKGELVGTLLDENKDLRKELTEQKEGFERLQKSCDMWKDKNHELEKLHACDADKIETLTKSEDFLSGEVDRLREELGKENRECEDLQREVEYLRNRGFWGRLFNK